MSSILDLAKKDWKRFSQSSFDLDLIITTPDSSHTVTVKGIGTRRSITFETDGQDVIGNMVHIGFSEQLLLETNPSYPTREGKGLVKMHNHRVNFRNATGQLKNYVIKQQYPDDTIGMIMCDCDEFRQESSPTTPIDIVFSKILSDSLTVEITSTSAGIETGFSWQRSLTGLSGSFIEVAQTATGVTQLVDNDGGAGLNPETKYFYQVVALGDINSAPSVIASETTEK